MLNELRMMGVKLCYADVDTALKNYIFSFHQNMRFSLHLSHPTLIVCTGTSHSCQLCGCALCARKARRNRVVLEVAVKTPRLVDCHVSGWFPMVHKVPRDTQLRFSLHENTLKTQLARPESQNKSELEPSRIFLAQGCCVGPYE